MNKRIEETEERESKPSKASTSQDVLIFGNPQGLTQRAATQAPRVQTGLAFRHLSSLNAAECHVVGFEVGGKIDSSSEGTGKRRYYDVGNITSKHR